MNNFKLDNIPDVLEFTGEFGVEMVLFLPFVNWLSEAGLLRNRKVISYQGMQTFYDSLQCKEVSYKNDARSYLSPEQRPFWLPVKNEHTFDSFQRSPFHLYPDLRKKYANTEIFIDRTLSKPILLIHNKYNYEWDQGPVNFIPIRTLEIIFKTFSDRFQIIYARHRGGGVYSNFSEDHNRMINFEDDFLLVKKFPNVIDFDVLYRLNNELIGIDINHFKNALLAKTYYYITSQGGGAHHISLFSGSAIVINHKLGDETNWAYSHGYYNFMAPVAPTLMVCQSEEQIISSCAQLSKSSICDDRVSFFHVET